MSDQPTADDEPPAVISDERDIDEAPLGATLRKMLAQVRDAGWLTVVRRTVLAHPATRYKGGDNMGQVKTAAKEVSHVFITARHPIAKLRLGFTAEWTEGVTPKGAASFGFVSAFVHDPVGRPVELHFDYEPGANVLRRVKDEPEFAWRKRVDGVKADAARCDASYNDGAEYVQREYALTAWRELQIWIGESIALAPQLKGAAA